MSMSMSGMSPPDPSRYANPPSNLSTSAPSALFGHPAANVNDWYIIKALERQSGLPDGVANPAMGIPFEAPSTLVPYNSRGPSIAGTAAMVIFITLAVTTTRLCLRFFRKDLRVGYDDMVIIPAALGVCTWFALTIAMVVKGGAGKHLYDVTYMEIYWFGLVSLVSFIIEHASADCPSCAQFANVCTIMFYPIVGLISISITLFNRRLTGLTSKRWMIAHNIFLTILAIYIVVSILVILFGCLPPAHVSLISIGKLAKTPKCMNINTLGTSLSAFHVAFDFALLTVPLIVLYNMNMSNVKKLRLAFLFSVGSVSCIGAVMRQVIQKQNAADLTWAFQTIYAWTTVDLVFAICAASLPVLNAAIPRSWRSPNSEKKLRNLSLLEQGSQQSKGSSNYRRDGTVLDVDKDSFHKKTEQRWDDAFEKGLTRPDMVHHFRQGDDSTEWTSDGKVSLEATLYARTSREEELSKKSDSHENNIGEAK